MYICNCGKSLGQCNLNPNCPVKNNQTVPYPWQNEHFPSSPYSYPNSEKSEDIKQEDINRMMDNEGLFKKISELDDKAIEQLIDDLKSVSPIASPILMGELHEAFHSTWGRE